MSECYSLINQVYASYKTKLDVYFDPMFYELTQCCFQDYEDEDTAKKQDMISAFYDLLDTIITHSPHLLYSKQNAPYLSYYLGVLQQGLTTSDRIPVVKLCICCYRKLAGLWFDHAVNVPEEVRGLYSAHLLNEVVPFLFQIYQMPYFNIKDPSTITSVNEIATLLFILEKNHPDFDQ